MPYPSRGLVEHREMIANNPLCFSQDKERAIKNWIEHAWKGVRGSATLTKSKASPILKEMALLVWEAQGGAPLFSFGRNESPVCWNSPRYGTKNYIMYEIGHMNPISNGGTSQPENLCFQSARCNQHIQSSLPMDEVIGFYFQTNEEVKARLESLQSLHKTNLWKELKASLMSD